jgi:hypothetical protein
MAEQTREQKEAAIKVVSLAMWSAVGMLLVLAVLFYLEIIPSEQGDLIAMGLAGLALLDVIVIKVLTAKMRANLDPS